MNTRALRSVVYVLVTLPLFVACASQELAGDAADYVWLTCPSPITGGECGTLSQARQVPIAPAQVDELAERFRARYPRADWEAAIASCGSACSLATEAGVNLLELHLLESHDAAVRSNFRAARANYDAASPLRGVLEVQRAMQQATPYQCQVTRIGNFYSGTCR